MAHPIVIFGTSPVAELANFYFTNDSEYDVVAFTVDQAYLSKTEFCNRPVVPFEQVAEIYPPDRFGFFVALSYAKLNRVRSEKVAAAREKSYRLVSYLSSRAIVFQGFEIKENCFILEGNIIQPFARVGANVTLWGCAHVGHHSVIEDNVFIAPHVVISGGARIGQGSFLGIGATVREHVTIGKECVLGIGALVLQNQPDFSLVAPRATERAKVPSTHIRSI